MDKCVPNPLYLQLKNFRLIIFAHFSAAEPVAAAKPVAIMGILFDVVYCKKHNQIISKAIIYAQCFHKLIFRTAFNLNAQLAGSGAGHLL